MTKLVTVYGTLATKHGLLKGNTFRALSAGAVLDHQPPIPVDIGHRHRQVGRCVHLERDRHTGNLLAVAEVDADALAAASITTVAVGDKVVGLESPTYWSGEFGGVEQIGLRLYWLSMTTRPAMMDIAPLRCQPGRLDYRSVAAERWHLHGHELELLTRAAESRRFNRGGVDVVDVDRMHYMEWEQRQGMATVTPTRRVEVEVFHSAGGRVLGVR